MNRVRPDLPFVLDRRGGAPAADSAADRPAADAEWFRDRSRGEAALADAFGDAGPDFEAEEPVPDRIGKFEIRGVLGRGGMGVVYDGWDPHLDCAVAVKVLRPAGPSAAADDLSVRLVREGSLLARLKHAHVVRVYSADVWAGQPYLAMDRVEGGTLADRLDDLSHRGPRAVAGFIEKVARAVHFAHAQGILHRDLKPANILVDPAGDPQVSDFGLAKLYAEDDPRGPADILGEADYPGTADPSVSGVQLGTPAYMAPEQYDRAVGPIGPGTDVWALGVVLYEVLTGAKPFAGDTYGELMEGVCHGPTPAYRAAGRKFTRSLDAVVGRCLAKAPADRYATAGALAADLGLVLAGESPTARPRTWAYRAWRTIRARRWPLATGAVVLAAVLIGAAMVPRSPEQMRADRERDIRRALGRGDTYTLRTFGPDPAAYRWPVQVGGPGSADVTGGVNTLTTLGAGLFEVCPDPGCDRYRFSVKLRQVGASGNARVSLYFGYREQVGPDGGRLGGYFSLGFADLSNDAGGQNLYLGRVGIQAHTFEVFPRLHRISPAPIGKPVPFLPNPHFWQSDAWREVAIEITPTRVRAIWVPKPGGPEVEVMNRPVADLTAVQGSLATSWEGKRPLNCVFDPRGGMGIYVDHGAVVVSEVTIGPAGPTE